MTTTSSPSPSPKNVAGDAAGEVTENIASLTPRQRTQAISGLMMGMFVAILAGTVVSTALPRIIHDLGASQSSYTWVITLELLAMTATVPLWGKLADLYNNKLLVQLSLGFFVVGSVVAGLAPNI
jgi:MFS family permease